LIYNFIIIIDIFYVFYILHYLFYGFFFTLLEYSEHWNHLCTYIVLCVRRKIFWEDINIFRKNSRTPES